MNACQDKNGLLTKKHDYYKTLPILTRCVFLQKKPLFSAGAFEMPYISVAKTKPQKTLWLFLLKQE
jgi:hypothetical protein